MNAAEHILRAAQKLSRMKCEVSAEDSTVIVHFHTDVSNVAFLMALGKVGLDCKVTKPQQVTKLGMDTIITTEINKGPRIHMQIDKRGFIDALTMEKP